MGDVGTRIDDTPLKPCEQLSQSDVLVALRKVHGRGKCDIWVDATTTFLTALPQEWREWGKGDLRRTAEEIWEKITKKSVEAWGETATYITRREETQSVFDNHTRGEIDKLVEAEGAILEARFVEVVERMRNCEVLVTFSGSERRCEFVSLVQARQTEVAQRIPDCLIKK